MEGKRAEKAIGFGRGETGGKDLARERVCTIAL